MACLVGPHYIPLWIHHSSEALSVRKARYAYTFSSYFHFRTRIGFLVVLLMHKVQLLFLTGFARATLQLLKAFSFGLMFHCPQANTTYLKCLFLLLRAFVSSSPSL